MKKYLVVTFLILLIFLISASYFLYDEAASLVISLSYWTILLFWVIAVLMFNLKVKTSFVFSFTFFIMAAFFIGINRYELGETLMKVSYIGWLVSLGKAFIKYRTKMQRI